MSYPTARARLDELSPTLGLDIGERPPLTNRRDVLDAVARGDLDVDAAMARTRTT